ncbi:hypothetical protein B9Z55_026263 [Caenorhabditis nigoni]|nr:hypothetical protein B9Z55_026263 [Caenorhabditis nigoni]
MFELKLEQNSQFCLLIHGAAGTGKSAVLRECRRIGEEIYGAGSVGVTAPVASAAVLVEGRTIHAFSQIALKSVGEFEVLTTIRRRCLEKVMGALKVLFIEEIGLLDPVLLAELDHVLTPRHHSEGYRSWDLVIYSSCRHWEG